MTVLPLILLMAVVTYATRAVPLLAGGHARLPVWMLGYLRLMAPATLVSLAAATLLTEGSALGIGVAAGVLGIGLIAWRGSLLLGILVACLTAAAGRAIGLS
jgi:branched-subunit amino acid transport protein